MNTALEYSDADIVLQTLSDKESFTVLVERYEEKLRRYIRRLGVRNEEDQDDVLQDIFIKTYKNLNGFDPALSFSSWVYRIAHNEAVSLFRHRSVRPEGSQVDDGDQMVRVMLDTDDVMHEIATRYDGIILSRALEDLDEKYRDVIILRFFEQKEYDEIADILKIPIGSVSTRLYRAKNRLRTLVELKVT
jgi:RNA polymerase sigma-70 factor (ECF subfamily)